MMAAFYASVPIIPVYCQEVGITGSKIGIVLTAMSITTVLFRPFAGYIIDNFNRYHVYLLFLGLFTLSFLGFSVFESFVALVVIRLYMGIVYSVCGSSTMTLAGDVLPGKAVTKGINRFTLTISIGMAAGPFVGIQIQNHMSSKASFLTLFVFCVIALICVSLCRMKYSKKERKPFSFKGAFHVPALPFMFNMMFIMVPFGAMLAYSSMLAGEKGSSAATPYFYVCLVVGMLISKFSTQKMIDTGRHKVLVMICLVLLTVTMASYYWMNSAIHFLIIAVLLGLGYGILQPLFQSLVTGTTPVQNRGTANATYMLSYDIGIGLGSLFMGFIQNTFGLGMGFALTAVCYIIAGIIFLCYTNNYYNKLVNRNEVQDEKTIRKEL